MRVLRLLWFCLACLCAGSTLAAEKGFEVEWLGEGALVDGPPATPGAVPLALEAGLIRDFGAGAWWRIRPAQTLEHEDVLPRVLYFAGGYASKMSIWLPGDTRPTLRDRFINTGPSWGSRVQLPLLVPAGVDLEQGILLHVSDIHGRRVRPMLADLDSYLAEVSRNKIVIACSATAALLLALLALLFSRSFPSPAYRWLALMAVLTAAYMLGLNGELYNLPGAGWLAQSGIAVDRTAAMGMALSASFFLTVFLDLQRRRRIARHGYRLLALAFALLIGMSWLQNPAPAAWGSSLFNLLALLMVLLTGWEALRACMQGHQSGSYLLWAWSPAMLALVIWIIVLEDWLPIGPVDLALLVAPALALQMLVLLLGVARDSERLRKERDLANDAAGHDALTGALNRRAAAQLMPELRLRHEQIGLVYLDLDHFKRVNDEYGHAAGDACLRQLVWRLQRALGEQDLLFRFGGEEFVIALPGRDLAAATACAEMLRSVVAGRPFPCNGRELRLSISVGVVRWRADESAAEALDRADRHLYQAKQEGRNRVVAEP
jgi:diguanylate cyclase (GGDEF)-like protein